MNLTLLAISVLPVFVLAMVVYFTDKYNKEPFGMLAKAFLFGALSIPPAALQESFLSLFDPQMPLFSGLYTGYVVAGFSEELWKLILLSLAVWRSRHFDEYYDGIVYACFVSLGFACFENISYVMGQGSYFDALQTGTIRAIVSVPGHFLFAVVMGYYFALAKFDPSRRFKYLFLALLVPTLLHGTFDALLMIPESFDMGHDIISGVLLLVFFWFDIKLWKWATRRIKQLQALSAEQARDFSNPFEGFKWNF